MDPQEFSTENPSLLLQAVIGWDRIILMIYKKTIELFGVENAHTESFTY